MPPAVCQPDLLAAALAERLSEAQEEELAQHLSECSSCRAELDRLAGAEEDWSRVQTALRQTPAPDHGSTDDIVDPHARGEWAADFAVNFLKPSQRDDALGRLDDIDILGVIGHGGMGIVLKGFQSELNRPVAVKVLAPHLASSGAARQRFGREAQAAAAIMHPNVMPILPSIPAAACLISSCRTSPASRCSSGLIRTVHCRSSTSCGSESRSRADWPPRTHKA